MTTFFSRQRGRAGRPRPWSLLPAGTWLVLVLGLAGTAQAQRAATFAAVTTSSTGSGSAPCAVALADVNHDGKLDLLTANYGSSTAGVQLGTGNGSFGAVATFNTGGYTTPTGLAVADVNGDGKLDLLTANRATSRAGVLLGNGDGTFQTVNTFDTGSYGQPSAIAVADVNGDGKLDVLTANTNGTAGVLLGNGTGSFGGVTTFSLGTGSPNSFVVADVNGDGKLDVLASYANSSMVGMLLGDGTGSFGTVTTFDTGSYINSLTVADVNGDGKLDLLTANANSTAGVLLGTGTGSFGPVSAFDAGGFANPTTIAVADVNGDGKPDLLTSNNANSTAGVLLGTGAGSFGAASTFSTGSSSQPTAIAVADVNGDGRPDLLTANGGSNTTGVLLNTTPALVTRTFLPAATFGTGSGNPVAIAVADVNRDGKLDVLTANYGSNTAGVWLGTGNGSFGAVGTYNLGSNPAAIAVADVNGDGKFDLLTANGDVTAEVLLGNGDGTFQAATTFSTGVNRSVAIAVADVNGDGKPDLLTAGEVMGTAGVLLGNGDGTFQAATTFNTGGDMPQGLAVADVNGDGKFDLLTVNGDGTAGELLGNGDGTFQAATTFSTGGNGPAAIAVADVNGDGKPDLLTANSGGTAGVLLGTGTGSFGAATAFNAGGNSPAAIAVADVNGDGKLDLLTANKYSNTAGVLLGTGTGSFGAATTFNTGGNYPESIVVADVNGDGKPDLLTANFNSNTASVLLGGLDLVVTTTTTVPLYADVLYNSLTVNSPGVATLTAATSVAGSTTVNSGGTLNDGCNILSGPGNFTLAAGGTLGICNAAGISSSGSTGSIQVTGTRTFATDALYTYQGSVAQVTGSGLPATVRSLTLRNSAGLTLTGPVTATSAAALPSGVLTTGANALTLGSAATLAETSTGYALGTVQTTRTLATAGAAETFGGLGLSLTPSGSTLPGSTLVVRTTGTARAGVGTSQSVKRVFDIRPTTTTGLNVALALTVRDDELNGIPAANLRLFKSDDAGSSWQAQAAATFATTAASAGQPTTYTASLGGIANFSLWTLGDAANPLPVQLVAFTAQASGPAAVALAWTTASEVNSAYFAVQRSADGTTWATLGRVAAAGSSASTRQYAWLDAAAPAGLSYYRLRQVDQDGTATYSPVRSVQLASQSAFAAQLYPNASGPADALTLLLHTRQAGPARWSLLDAVGRLVAEGSQELPLGATAWALPQLQALPSGVYLLQVRQGDNYQSLKLVRR